MALTEIKTSGIADDAVTADKLANAINTERTANTAKNTNATHTGDVTGSGALTIAAGAVDIAMLANGTDGQVITWDASGAPTAVGPGTDGQVLTSTGAGSPPAFETLPTSGAALTGSTNNTITTVTGANAIQGEANLTFDGSVLKTIGANGAVSPSSYSVLDFVVENNSESAIGIVGNTYSSLYFGDNATVHDAGIIYNHSSTTLEIRRSGNSTALEFPSDGDVKITDGDLVIGTAGHGIDFSATSDGSGASNVSELLDGYEQGTFSANYYDFNGSQIGTADGRYTKIGNTVRISVFEFANSASNLDDKDMQYITGFPFACRTEPNSVGTIVRYGGGNNATISASETCYIAQGGTQIRFDNTFNTGTGNWTTSLVYEV